MNPKRTCLAPLLRLILPLLLPLSMLLAMNAPAAAGPAASGQPKPHAAARHAARHKHPRKARKGQASYYGATFAGKTMANGEPMNPNSNVAASKTLPLGSKAKVTNLENGKSAEVVIKDRGPYVDGRIIDVSPKTADKLGLKKEGTAPVEVKPLPDAGGAPEGGRPAK